MRLQKQPLTLSQRSGKSHCYLVRQFGAAPWVVSEFWVTMYAGDSAYGFIRSSGRSGNQKTKRSALTNYLCATRKDANALRDELKAISPEPDYMNLS